MPFQSKHARYLLGLDEKFSKGLKEIFFFGKKYECKNFRNTNVNVGIKLVFLTDASKPLKRADVSARPEPWIVSR